MEISIEYLRTLCGKGHFKWTTHILARLQERGIQPSDVKHCISVGSILEVYPDNHPFPSCLVLGCSISGRPLHIVVGAGEDFLWLITAYYPDPDKWENEFSSRKEP